MADANEAYLVEVSGRVQGVGYRAWTRSEAGRLGLEGWVRNEADGSVTALIAGPKAATATMLERFRVGPFGAKVTEVAARPIEVSELPAGHLPSGFSIDR
ncbi:MAG: acylphosphatase [Neorhizobium sp.]|nr:acylphosphatase [Neorhizobium sp.]